MKTPAALLFNIALQLCLLFSISAQSNESPAGAYSWKKGKTDFQNGYVVLKSGKKMEGRISLKGDPGNISEVAYQDDGKELSFPLGSLKAYGLNGVNPGASASSAGVPVNESPENMYEWRSMGIVMNKEIHSTTVRPGYVVLRDGTKYEGELKLRKKAGVLDEFEINAASGKQKFDAPKVARYGYTISEEEAQQANLAKESKRSFDGTVYTPAGNNRGEITVQPSPGKRYVERIIFKSNDGQLKEYTPQSSTGFSVMSNKGKEQKYTVADQVFVAERFQGKTFQVYLNPNPTTINEFATSLVKGAVQAGTAATATAVTKADQKKNNYTSNIDSVIRISSTEDLKALRDEMVTLSGYASSQEALDQSTNESLKANLGALEFAIAGREIASSPGGIMNEEWIILNKSTKEKTVVYKSEYKNQIEILLMGCDKFLELTKSQQNDLRKWDNLEQAMKLLDSCY